MKVMDIAFPSPASQAETHVLSGALVHTDLDSSSLHSVEYSTQTTTLEVAFCRGSVYRYFDVPFDIYDALLRAESKGRYFIASIRTNFRFERLK